jgi:hypothetical protein
MQRDGQQDNNLPNADLLLQQLQQHLNHNPIVNTNDQIQAIRQQLLLQQLQPTANNQNAIPSDLLTKLLVQLQTQQMQIDQMRTIIDQMRSIIENQQQMIQGYQEQYNQPNDSANLSHSQEAPTFKQITIEDLNLSPPTLPTNVTMRGSFAESVPPVNNEYVEDSHPTNNNNLQQPNHERKRKQRNKRKRSKGFENNKELNDTLEQQQNELYNHQDDLNNADGEDGIVNANGKTLVYRGLPKRKNMKKTEFNVSKWTLK